MAPGGRRHSRGSHSDTLLTNSMEENTATSKKKGGRKTAENMILNNFLKNGGERPKIVIHPDKRRPLGKWSAQWATEIGIIFKQTIPLTWHYWKDVTKARKETIYKKILKKFDVDVSLPHVMDCINSSVRSKFKERRHMLHQHYLSIPDGEDKVAHCHKSVNQGELESLCKHFENEDFQKIC